MSFFIKDCNYNRIWDNVRNSINKGFDSESVYNEKYLKTRIKYYGGKISTNFHDDGIPKQGLHCIYLSMMLIKGE